jgi:hypothetical protein
MTLLSRNNLDLEGEVCFLDGPHKAKTSYEEDDTNKET